MHTHVHSRVRECISREVNGTRHFSPHNPINKNSLHNICELTVQR
uniref:Uncharacterized protein n=1 Tax=Rhizophora mucronata TaxID=61149 RepID=A0A2P2PJA2_RHIMU